MRKEILWNWPILLGILLILKLLSILIIRKHVDLLSKLYQIKKNRNLAGHRTFNFHLSC